MDAMMIPTTPVVSLLMLTVGAFFVARPATAGPCIDVAVLTTRGTPLLNDPLQDSLLSSGKLQSVAIGGFGSSFTASSIAEYDAVMTYMTDRTVPTNQANVPERIRVGDELSAYVASGGGVVLTMYDPPTGIDPWLYDLGGGPLGAFLDYPGMPVTDRTGSGPRVLGFEPVGESPIVQGIDGALCATRACRVEQFDSQDPSATVHAIWEPGIPAVVSLPGTVLLNLNPYFNTDNTGPEPTANAGTLYANALIWAAGHNPATACNGDTDDDGLLDTEEEVIGTHPEFPDTDNDGAIDSVDNCPTVANEDQQDTDGNGTGDACESEPLPDGDQDGVPDAVDNCPSTANPDQADTDGNGLGDACEPLPNDDIDSDGVLDDADNCPLVANPDQADADEDGTGDACDEATVSPGCRTLPNATGWAWLVLLPLLLRRRRTSTR